MNTIIYECQEVPTPGTAGEYNALFCFPTTHYFPSETLQPSLVEVADSRPLLARGLVSNAVAILIVHLFVWYV
jgi:hypothetical protein